jgi:S-adenosylmethionine synthetase
MKTYKTAILYEHYHIQLSHYITPPPPTSVVIYIFWCTSLSIHQAYNCLSCYVFIKLTWHISHSISIEQSITKIREVQHYGHLMRTTKSTVLLSSGRTQGLLLRCNRYA